METPALHALMGSYLHQDYDWFGTIDENVELFVRESPDLARGVPDEIERTLASLATDDELKAFVRGLGCQVRPPDDLTYRAWLTHIAEVVRAATA